MWVKLCVVWNRPWAMELLWQIRTFCNPSVVGLMRGARQVNEARHNKKKETGARGGWWFLGKIPKSPEFLSLSVLWSLEMVCKLVASDVFYHQSSHHLNQFHGSCHGDQSSFVFLSVHYFSSLDQELGKNCGFSIVAYFSSLCRLPQCPLQKMKSLLSSPQCVCFLYMCEIFYTKKPPKVFQPLKLIQCFLSPRSKTSKQKKRPLFSFLQPPPDLPIVRVGINFPCPRKIYSCLWFLFFVVSSKAHPPWVRGELSWSEKVFVHFSAQKFPILRARVCDEKKPRTPSISPSLRAVHPPIFLTRSQSLALWFPQRHQSSNPETLPISIDCLKFCERQ